MRLIEVNGNSLLGVTHQEAVNILRASGDTINMVVCKGYERSEVERLISEGKLVKESKSSSSRSQSVSSLDRDDEDSVIYKKEQEMKKELVEFEKEEEEERRIRERVENNEDELIVAEIRPKSTPEKVCNRYIKFHRFYFDSIYLFYFLGVGCS